MPPKKSKEQEEEDRLMREFEQNFALVQQQQAEDQQQEQQRQEQERQQQIQEQERQREHKNIENRQRIEEHVRQMTRQGGSVVQHGFSGFVASLKPISSTMDFGEDDDDEEDRSRELPGRTWRTHQKRRQEQQREEYKKEDEFDDEFEAQKPDKEEQKAREEAQQVKKAAEEEIMRKVERKKIETAKISADYEPERIQWRNLLTSVNNIYKPGERTEYDVNSQWNITEMVDTPDARKPFKLPTKFFDEKPLLSVPSKKKEPLLDATPLSELTGLCEAFRSSLSRGSLLGDVYLKDLAEIFPQTLTLDPQDLNIDDLFTGPLATYEAEYFRNYLVENTGATTKIFSVGHMQSDSPKVKDFLSGTAGDTAVMDAAGTAGQNYAQGRFRSIFTGSEIRPDIYQPDIYQPEAEYSRILCASIYFVLQNLREGGKAVVVFPHLFTLRTVEFMAMICSVFETVEIFLASPVADLQYVVCSNFRRRFVNLLLKRLELFLTSELRKHIMDVDKCPLLISHLLAWNRGVYKRRKEFVQTNFMNLETEISNRQIRLLTRKYEDMKRKMAEIKKHFMDDRDEHTDMAARWKKVQDSLNERRSFDIQRKERLIKEIFLQKITMPVVDLDDGTIARSKFVAKMEEKWREIEMVINATDIVSVKSIPKTENIFRVDNKEAKNIDLDKDFRRISNELSSKYLYSLPGAGIFGYLDATGVFTSAGPVKKTRQITIRPDVGMGLPDGYKAFCYWSPCGSAHFHIICIWDDREPTGDNFEQFLSLKNYPAIADRRISVADHTSGLLLNGFRAATTLERRNALQIDVDVKHRKVLFFSLDRGRLVRLRSSSYKTLEAVTIVDITNTISNVSRPFVPISGRTVDSSFYHFAPPVGKTAYVLMVEDTNKIYILFPEKDWKIPKHFSSILEQTTGSDNVLAVRFQETEDGWMAMRL